MGKAIKVPKISVPKITLPKIDPMKAVGGLIAPVAQIGTQLVGGLVGGLLPKGSGGGGGSAPAPSGSAPTGSTPTGTQSWQVPGDPNWQGNPTAGFAPNNPYAAPRVDSRRSLLRGGSLGNQSTAYKFQPRFNNLRGYLGNQTNTPASQPSTPAPAPAQPVQAQPQPQQPTPPAQPAPQPAQEPTVARPAPQIQPVDYSNDPRWALAQSRMIGIGRPG